jgi:plasmid stabilization system protein ParE
VRIAPHASHLIVYLVDDQGIIVVRVLHESMDVDAQMEER